MWEQTPLWRSTPGKHLVWLLWGGLVGKMTPKSTQRECCEAGVVVGVAGADVEAVVAGVGVVVILDRKQVVVRMHSQ